MWVKRAAVDREGDGQEIPQRDPALGLTASASGATRRHDDDRTGSVQHDGMTDRPEHQLREAAVAPGADHEQVSVVRQLEQRLGRVPILDHHTVDLDAGQCLAHLAERRLEELLGVGPGEVLDGGPVA